MNIQFIEVQKLKKKRSESFKNECKNVKRSEKVQNVVLTHTSSDHIEYYEYRIVQY